MTSLNSTTENIEERGIDLCHAESVNTHASRWMKRGIALLNENAPASLSQAVQCFDSAIELRRTLPLGENNLFRYGLAAGWMNRGDALTRLGEPQNLAEAVNNYDEALDVLRELPVKENPLFRRRHAIAWLNRGITLQVQNMPASLVEAARSFEQAIELLETAYGDEDRRVLAAAWMNYGNVLLQPRCPDSVWSSAFRRQEMSRPPEGGTPNVAQAAARKCLECVGVDEAADMVAAEIGFKARHILCRAIAHLLESRNAVSADELIAEATDAVDEAMKLARHWELRGVGQFRPLTAEIFRFGCRAYQTYQPHFLTEFVMESLDPEHSSGAMSSNRDMHATAVEAIWRSLVEVQREGFKSLNTPRFEELLEKLRELRVTEERLIELRRRYLIVSS